MFAVISIPVPLYRLHNGLFSCLFLLFLGSSVWVRASDLSLGLVPVYWVSLPLIFPQFAFTIQILWKKTLRWSLGARSLLGINTWERELEEARVERKEANDGRGPAKFVPTTQSFPECWLWEFPHWAYIPQSTHPTPSRSVKRHDLREAALCADKTLKKLTV